MGNSISVKKNEFMYKKGKVIFLCRFLLFSCFPTAVMSAPHTDKKILNEEKINFTLIKREDVFADTNSLKKALMDYMEKVDSGRYAKVILYYDSAFLSLRVVDAGQFIKMDYKQMVYFWNMQIKKQTSNSFNHQAIITQKTTIYYMEILGNTGYIFLTGIKFGKRPGTYVLYTRMGL